MTYTPPSVVDLVGETLDRANDALAANPDRRLYVAHGDPVPAPIEACDQLTAHLVRLRPKLLRDSQQVQAQSRLVVWVAVVAVVRFLCVPSLTDEATDPPAGEVDAAHRALLADGTAIARHLSRLWATKAWPDAVPNCGDVTWNPLEPLAPQGAAAGWRLAIDVQL